MDLLTAGATNAMLFLRRLGIRARRLRLSDSAILSHPPKRRNARPLSFSIARSLPVSWGKEEMLPLPIARLQSHANGGRAEQRLRTDASKDLARQ